MHRITLPLLLTMFFYLIGCSESNTPNTATPDELSTVQGDWQFDEAGYLESMRARHKDHEKLKKMVDLYEFAKTNGTPVMTDITISGSRIMTGQGRLRQQYELSGCRSEGGGRIVAKALWHEDLNDPGDASTIDVVFQLDGTNLSVTLFDKGSGEGETFPFKRK